jgi:S1-C subfamily serine protease
VAVPVFVTSAGADEYTVSGSDHAVLPGMPLFTLSGELFALAAPDGARVRAPSVRQAAERLLARASSGDRRSSFGLGYQIPEGGVADIFGREGALVTAVLAGGPGDAAAIRVGDVLLAVGGVTIDSVETAARLLSTAAIGTPTVLRVRRGARVSEIEATPSPAYEVAALAHSSADVAPAPEARALFPAAVLEASAIPATARVISVNGRPVTARAQVQRELRLARQPIPVLLRAGGNQFFASVAPSR